MRINLFAIAGLCVAVVCFLLSFFILINSKKRLHRLWALFNISVGIFGLGTFFVGISHTYEQAFLSWKMTLFGVSLIAMFFYHVVYEFCHLNNPKMLRFVYFHGIFFAVIGLITDFVFHSMRYAFNQFYYYNAGIGFNLLFPIWLFIVFNAFIRLFFYISKAKGLSSTQGKYLFWGMLLGFLGGSTTSFPSWGIDVYPAWLFFICIYATVSTYAIFRYHIMDIRIAVTRLGIFILVYSLVLGIPIGLDVWGKSWLINHLGAFGEWIPRLTMLVFATAGPFVYFFIQKKAEDQLTQEEIRRRDLLKTAITGFNTIRNLEKLIRTLVTIIIKNFRINYTSIYLFDKERGRYEQKYSSIENNYVKILNSESPIIKYSYDIGFKIIIVEEFEFASTVDNKTEILSELKNVSASLLVPITFDNFLLGFIVMENLSSGKPYSKMDLDILSVVGSGAGVAIDGCYEWEEKMKIMDELGLQERMSSLDMMAGSIAHEIHNPIHAISQEVSYIEESVRELKECDNVPQDTLTGLSEAGHNIGELAERVKNMVNTILQFAKKGNTKLEQVFVNDVVSDFEILMKPHFKHDHLVFTKDIEANLPPIYVNRVLLVTALMNFAKNSIHAIRTRPEKKIHLKIYSLNNKIKIEFSDNGYGIEEHKLQVIFAAFQTSKGTSEGTGLGLYRARRDIVDHFKGKLWATSEGVDKGATIHCELPVYTKPTKGDLDG